MKKLISIFLSILPFLTVSKALACQSLDGLSLFSGSPLFVLSSGHKYEGPETKDKKKFESIPAFKAKSLSYEQCRHSLWVFEIQSHKLTTLFKALVSYEDRCDGGNTHGALFNQEMTQIVATIQDTEIFCSGTH